MMRSPLIDTSDVLEFAGLTMVVHDGRVPDSYLFAAGEDIYVVRRKGGYTCHRMMNHVQGKYCWTAVSPNLVERLARAIERDFPEVYKTITWSEP